MIIMPKNQPITTVDNYINNLPSDRKMALQTIRKIIFSTVPDCHERIAYKIIVFSLHKDLVGLASQPNFCSFYTMSPALMMTMKPRLGAYDVSGATIHFLPEKMLPPSLINTILKARIQEIIQ